MTARVRSTNLSHVKPDPGADRVTGIEKRPVADGIEVSDPGSDRGVSGVAGDVIGDLPHHGGSDKAVYALGREELDHWEGELGRSLPDGWFGENLTTEGIEWEALVVGQQVRIGETVLEVSVPRTPCATFQRHMGEERWVKRFTEHGGCGSYLVVRTPGTIRPGDTVEVQPAPAGTVTMGTAFRAAMGDRDAAETVLAALDDLPEPQRGVFAAKLRRS